MTKITHFDEKHARMRAYSRKWRYFQRFKIEPNRFFALLDSQGQACAVCSAPYDDTEVWVPVRNNDNIVLGIVCPVCAKGLWAFKYDAYLLARAMAFIDSDPPLEYPHIRNGFDDLMAEVLNIE